MIEEGLVTLKMTREEMETIFLERIRPREHWAAMRASLPQRLVNLYAYKPKADETPDQYEWRDLGPVDPPIRCEAACRILELEKALQEAFRRIGELSLTQTGK